MKKRFAEEQIIGLLREAEADLPVKELCRRHGFSEASYCLWRSRFGGMDVSDAKRLNERESEHARLKRLLADAMLENEVTREALRRQWLRHRHAANWCGTCNGTGLHGTYGALGWLACAACWPEDGR